MSRRMLVGAGVLSLVIPAMVAGGPAGADDDPGARFQNTQAGPVDPAVQPPSLDTTPVTVMVEFDKDSVATAMANRGGKLKTMLQSVAIPLYLLPLPHVLDPVAVTVMLAAFVVTIVTGLDYCRAAWRLRRDARARA